MSVVAFALLLGFMVLIHELGHFALAKLARIKVEEFGIGFPPRLIAARRGETEYSLNWIPLGGFVRMLGEEDPTQPRSFARSPKLWRVRVVPGSPAEQVGLQKGDVVISLGGQPVKTTGDLRRITEENLGKPIPAEVK